MGSSSPGSSFAGRFTLVETGKVTNRSGSPLCQHRCPVSWFEKVNL